jgi:UDP:flavonoid glycosyltransferase YjiC (YdhE family)
VTLLVVSPDYASHLLPLATLATAWREAGERVVVASGPATAEIARSFGFEHREVALARGSNPGIARPEEQPPGEDASLRGFFAVTRRGMVATLEYQARERLTDLLWEPVSTGHRVLDAVEAVGPSEVLVDHLAFSARIALSAAGVPHGDVVLGHPSALPLAGERYGYPSAWPAAFAPDPAALERLRTLCDRVTRRFTDEWNAALVAQGSDRLAEDAFAEHGDRVLFNYPAPLAADRPVPPGSVFLGAAVREEPPDDEVDDWLAAGDRPFVYVSFGSFLSARTDVLARTAQALADAGLLAAVATGSADPAALGPLPHDWLVRAFLPQVRLLARASAAVTHGGNNSVTEALAFGVPLVVLPFSTDQFAGAAALEAQGLAEVLDPNAATAEELAWAIGRALAPAEARRRALDDLARSLRAEPGPQRAYRALTGETARAARV